MRQRIRVSLVILDGNQVLLVRENAPDSPEHAGPDGTWWQLPGGGLEIGETIFEAARREALEETGLLVQPERIIAVQKFIRFQDGFHQVEFYVLVRIINGTPAVPEDDHVLEIRFFDRDAASCVPTDFAIPHAFWDGIDLAFPDFRLFDTVYVDELLDSQSLE